MDIENEKKDFSPLRLAMENILLKEDLKNLKESINELKDWAKGLEEEKSELVSKIHYFEYFHNELRKALNLGELDLFEISHITDKIASLNEIKKEADIYKNEYNKLANQKDWVYVTQFDNLLWGDNYPALKVFFNFLQEWNAVNINWSYFADCMGSVDKPPIEIHTAVLKRNDIGYLFYLIKPFFLKEYTGTKTRYFAILQRKFLLDGKQLEADFDRKQIRDYKSGKIPSMLQKDIIDSLIENIEKKYK